MVEVIGVSQVDAEWLGRVSPEMPLSPPVTLVQR
jgi:hypothetical protein